MIVRAKLSYYSNILLNILVTDQKRNELQRRMFEWFFSQFSFSHYFFCRILYWNLFFLTGLIHNQSRTYTFQRECDMREMMLINKRIAYHITRCFSLNSIRYVALRCHVGTQGRKTAVSTSRNSFILHSAEYHAHLVNRVTPVDSFRVLAVTLLCVQSLIWRE